MSDQMHKANRPNRKASDEDLLDLNSLGYSLQTIGDRLSIHPSTATQRLKGLGVSPADTRRTFMEDILNTMPAVQVERLSQKLSAGYTIKDHVRALIIKDLTSP